MEHIDDPLPKRDPLCVHLGIQALRAVLDRDLIRTADDLHGFRLRILFTGQRHLFRIRIHIQEIVFRFLFIQLIVNGFSEIRTGILQIFRIFYDRSAAHYLRQR